MTDKWIKLTKETEKEMRSDRKYKVRLKNGPQHTAFFDENGKLRDICGPEVRYIHVEDILEFAEIGSE